MAEVGYGRFPDDMNGVKRIMILGASAAQVPIIRKASELGFETVSVSVPGNYPGFEVSDRYYEIDIRDRERILSIARAETISGILTDQTDIAVPTVAYVAERLGLPGIGSECALNFTNKFRMRSMARELGVPVPGFVMVQDRNDVQDAVSKLTPPYIVKPVDSQGSRGVSKVSHPSDLWAHVQNAARFSPDGQVIVEEFFYGVETVVQGFVSNYKVFNLALADREYFDLPGMLFPKQRFFQAYYPILFKQRLWTLI